MTAERLHGCHHGDAHYLGRAFSKVLHVRAMAPRVAPGLQLIADAQLQPAKGNGATITAGALWHDSPVLFLLIRRPGCVLCRAEARRIWSLRADIESRGVKLVCLV